MNNPGRLQARFSLENSSWPPIAWIVILVISSLQPFRPVIMARNGTWAHLILHVLVFGFAAFLLLNRAVASWVVVLGTLCLATGIELLQHLIYGQRLEWRDLCADALGIALAILWQSCTRRSSFARRL